MHEFHRNYAEISQESVQEQEKIPAFQTGDKNRRLRILYLLFYILCIYKKKQETKKEETKKSQLNPRKRKRKKRKKELDNAHG
jgi:hypothetical protein